MNKLIFQPFFGGHSLEYIQHLYYNCTKDQNSVYYFALPKEFLKYGFIDNKNVKLIHIDEDKIKNINSYNKIKKSHLTNLYLRSIIQQYNIKEVFLITYDHFYPLLPFYTLHDVKYYGIFYFIYLYKWKDLSLKHKLYHKTLMYFMAKNNSIEKIFICNDSSASAYFNKIFKTHKFQKLVDPYVPIKPSIIDIKKEYNITNKYILLHLGALSKRKGTIEILDSIPFITNINEYCFIFAGKIGNDIKEIFYQKVNLYKAQARIIVKDEFCSFDFIAGLCQVSDLILMPYTETSQSSGMFGYASQFNIPILAPKKGLLKKIIQKYHLGFFLETPTAKSIGMAINNIFKTERPTIPSQYIEENDVKTFTNVFFHFKSK